MKKKGNGDIVIRPWLATILLALFLGCLGWAGAAATYVERSAERGRRLERIETTVARVEKNQVKIATHLGIELKE